MYFDRVGNKSFSVKILIGRWVRTSQILSRPTTLFEMRGVQEFVEWVVQVPFKDFIIVALIIIKILTK